MPRQNLAGSFFEDLCRSGMMWGKIGLFKEEIAVKVGGNYRHSSLSHISL
jgi:hypothetical protein